MNVDDLLEAADRSRLHGAIRAGLQYALRNDAVDAKEHFPGLALAVSTSRVMLTPAAVSNLHDIATWWRLNRRSAWDDVEQGLAHAIEQVARAPLSCPVYAPIAEAVVRRATMPRARHAAYFVVYSATCYLVTLWRVESDGTPP